MTEPTITELTDTSAAITWPALTNPPADYEFNVYLNGAVAARLEPNAEKTYKFDNLKPGVTYSFGVQAVDKSNTDLTSSMLEKSVCAYAREDIWGGSIAAFKNYTGNSVTLVMPQVPNATVQKYIIRDEQGNVVAEVTEGNEYNITGLTSGQQVNYTVQAVVEQDGATKYTSLLLATTILDTALIPWPEGSNISVNNLTNTGALLSWKSFGDMSGRRYQVKLNGKVKGTTTDTSYAVSDLTPSTVYDAVITVVDENGKAVSHNLALRFNTLKIC